MTPSPVFSRSTDWSEFQPFVWISSRNRFPAGRTLTFLGGGIGKRWPEQFLWCVSGYL